MNSESIVGNQKLAGFGENLPDADNFNVKYIDEQKDSDEFNILISESAREYPPYSYGSYQIYEADPDSKQYQFISYVNLTSQDSSALFPQFMYESILKEATNDPEFSFKVRNTPYPPVSSYIENWQAINSSLIVFVTAIGYSVSITAIVSYLVVERRDGLKHL